jgi:hypothetical protein
LRERVATLAIDAGLTAAQIAASRLAVTEADGGDGHGLTLIYYVCDLVRTLCTAQEGTNVRMWVLCGA